MIYEYFVALLFLSLMYRIQHSKNSPKTHKHLGYPKMTLSAVILILIASIAAKTSNSNKIHKQQTKKIIKIQKISPLNLCSKNHICSIKSSAKTCKLSTLIKL